MKLNVLKTIVLLLLLNYGIGCRPCKNDGYKNVKAGVLKLEKYRLYKKGALYTDPLIYSRANDSLLFLLSISPLYSLNQNQIGGSLYACDISVPSLNTNLDSVNVITLSDFDNFKKANENINNYCKTFKVEYDSSKNKYPILSFNELKNFDINPGVLLVNKPTTDSIRLRITYYLQTGDIRSVETKWLKFY